MNNVTFFSVKWPPCLMIKEPFKVIDLFSTISMPVTIQSPDEG
ncbi:unnamed protein product [marine sediment metagenome]|uniref:Uncharacterized protein n=1 Tax=marine sediment metagenome TaxID=412755 RepID=X0S3E8_9ZZZZ